MQRCLLTLFLSLVILSPVAMGEETLVRPPAAPAPGQEATFGVRGIAEAKRQDGTPQDVPFVLYLPANWNKERKWPVVLEWHGAGGSAGVPISRAATGGKDFILVGLTYINAQAKTEYRYLDVARRLVLDEFQGDQEAVFPGGFSFGGLAQERFVLRPETIGRYRGVWIFGAGLIELRDPAFLAHTPFFVAVGETDFNRKAVEQMLPRFQKTIKEIEFHVMPGIGHAVDLPNYGPKLLAFFNSHLPKAAKAPGQAEASKPGGEGQPPSGPAREGP